MKRTLPRIPYAWSSCCGQGWRLRLQQLDILLEERHAAVDVTLQRTGETEIGEGHREGEEVSGAARVRDGFTQHRFAVGGATDDELRARQLVAGGVGDIPLSERVAHRDRFLEQRRGGRDVTLVVECRARSRQPDGEAPAVTRLPHDRDARFEILHRVRRPRDRPTYPCGRGPGLRGGGPRLPARRRRPPARAE